MKILSGTRLVIVVAIAFISISVVLSFAQAGKPRHKRLHVMLNEITAWKSETAFKTALHKYTANTYRVHYHGVSGVTASEGSLDDLCPTPTPSGEKTRVNVTQQMSFDSKGQLQKFMTDAFP